MNVNISILRYVIFNICATLISECCNFLANNVLCYMKTFWKFIIIIMRSNYHDYVNKLWKKSKIYIEIRRYVFQTCVFREKCEFQLYNKC